MGAIYYTRIRDGSYKVEIQDNAYLLHTPKGPVSYATPRLLLADITGHPTGRNWSLDRYFRIRTYSRRAGEVGPDAAVLKSWFSKRPKNPTSAGVSVGQQHLDIRRLVLHGYGAKIAARGLDVEDVIQEVCRAVIVRNDGDGRFDASRSSFGHYIYMVTRSVLSHMGKQSRRWQQEVSSSAPPSYADEDSLTLLDKTACPNIMDAESMMLLRDAVTVAKMQLGERLGPQVDRALPHIMSGSAHKDVARQLGISADASKKIVSAVVRAIRSVATL